jgi:hypothetical protein
MKSILKRSVNVLEEVHLKRKTLVLLVVALFVITTICGCGKTITTTQTEIHTVTGPIITQTVSITGPVTTTTQVITTSGPVTITTQISTSIVTATITGPTTTLTQTKTGIPTQGFIYVSSITPASPGTLHSAQWVSITVDYVITDQGGARMWAIPTTNGQNTPNCSYGASGLVQAGRGTTLLGFSIASGSVKIDEIHFLMKNSTNITLFDAYIPVDFSVIP